MSKRTATRDRGEPPSYFQSILCSNYGRRQTDIPVTGGNHSSQDTTSYPSSVTSSSTVFINNCMYIKYIYYICII